MHSPTGTFRLTLAAWLLSQSAHALGADPGIGPLDQALNGAGCGYTDLAPLRLSQGQQLTLEQARDDAHELQGDFLVVESDSLPDLGNARIAIDGVERALPRVPGDAREYASGGVRVYFENWTAIPMQCGTEECAGSLARVTVIVETTSGSLHIDALEHCGC